MTKRIMCIIIGMMEIIKDSQQRGSRHEWCRNQRDLVGEKRTIYGTHVSVCRQFHVDNNGSRVGYARR